MVKGYTKSQFIIRRSIIMSVLCSILAPPDLREFFKNKAKKNNYGDGGRCTKNILGEPVGVSAKNKTSNRVAQI